MMLQETQEATMRAIRMLEGLWVDEDDLLAWAQLEKELLVTMTRLLELEVQQAAWAQKRAPAEAAGARKVS